MKKLTNRLRDWSEAPQVLVVLAVSLLLLVSWWSRLGFPVLSATSRSRPREGRRR